MYKRILKNAFALAGGATVVKGYSLPSERGLGRFAFYVITKITAGAPALSVSYRPILRHEVIPLEEIYETSLPSYVVVKGSTLKVANVYRCGAADTPFTAIAIVEGDRVLCKLELDSVPCDAMEFSFTETVGAGNDATIQVILAWS